jgi:hypothetical protein
VAALRPKERRNFDLAARDRSHDRGAQVRFERAQIVVDAELQVEEARVDALDLDRQGSRSALSLVATA